MTSRIQQIAVDCHNAYELSEWWKEVLDYTDIPDDPNLPGHEECVSSTHPAWACACRGTARRTSSPASPWLITMVEPVIFHVALPSNRLFET